jgi:hypothetical protein
MLAGSVSCSIHRINLTAIHILALASVHDAVTAVCLDFRSGKNASDPRLTALTWPYVRPPSCIDLAVQTRGIHVPDCEDAGEEFTEMRDPTSRCYTLHDMPYSLRFWPAEV